MRFKRCWSKNVDLKANLWWKINILFSCKRERDVFFPSQTLKCYRYQTFKRPFSATIPPKWLNSFYIIRSTLLSSKTIPFCQMCISEIVIHNGLSLIVATVICHNSHLQLYTNWTFCHCVTAISFRATYFLNCLVALSSL